MVTRGICWQAGSCFFAPHYTSTLEYAVAYISQCLRGAEILVAGYFNAYLEALESTSEKIIFPPRWQQRAWNTWQSISSLVSISGKGVVGRDSCYVAARKCDTGWIKSLGQTAVCSKMLPSRIPDTTRTTTLFRGAFAAWHWESISATLGCACGSHSSLQLIPHPRTLSSCPSGRPFQSHR